MNTTKVTYAIVQLSVTALLASFARAQSSASTPGEKAPYHVSQTLRVGGEGGRDYLTVDSEHKLLYVPRSTHTMVLAADTGKTVADISGQKRNHGVAIVPGTGRGRWDGLTFEQAVQETANQAKTWRANAN